MKISGGGTVTFYEVDSALKVLGAKMTLTVSNIKVYAETGNESAQAAWKFGFTIDQVSGFIWHDLRMQSKRKRSKLRGRKAKEALRIFRKIKSRTARYFLVEYSGVDMSDLKRRNGMASFKCIEPPEAKDVLYSIQQKYALYNVELIQFKEVSEKVFELYNREVDKILLNRKARLN